jgi:hypothetical protein
MADHIISMKSKVKWECYCDINVVVISFKLYLRYLTIATIATDKVVKIAEQHADLLCMRWQPSINFLETIIITQPVLKQSISSCFTTIWCPWSWMIVGREELFPASSTEINMLELRNWLITMAKRTDQSSWFLP